MRAPGLWNTLPEEISIFFDFHEATLIFSVVFVFSFFFVNVFYLMAMYLFHLMALLPSPRLSLGGDYVFDPLCVCICVCVSE